MSGGFPGVDIAQVMHRYRCSLRASGIGIQLLVSSGAPPPLTAILARLARSWKGCYRRRDERIYAARDAAGGRFRASANLGAAAHTFVPKIR
jgi:hypothetical protein